MLVFTGMIVEKLKDECCAVGQSAIFTCRLKENEQVTWYHFNTEILSSRRTILFSKNNVHTLKIIDVTLEDRGQYTIKAQTIEYKASLVITGT